MKPPATKKTIDPARGQRLRAVRVAKGLTQAVLAARLGWRVQQVSDLEREVCAASLDKLQLCAEALGCKLSDIEPSVS